MTEPRQVTPIPKKATRGRRSRFDDLGYPAGVRVVVGVDGMGRPRRRTPDIVRFNAKVDRSRACWEWTAARDANGYGVFHYADGRRVLAHRWSYEHHVGPIPDGLWVRHQCDNPPCVNPEHLLVGTPMDNSRDMVRRGRTNPLRNERSPMTKLSDEQVAAVRAAVAGGALQKDVAAQFGVHPAHVSRIVNWRRRP